MHHARVCSVLCALLLALPTGAVDAGAGPSRIAFGACPDQRLPQPIRDAVLGDDPDVFVFAGDNVYGEVSSVELVEAQWAWLEERLREPAELRLIVSSMQVPVQGHGWERWGNLPGERARLFELLRTTKANGVVFLSGDRHFAGLCRRHEGAPCSLFEIASSTACTGRAPTRAGATLPC